MSTNDDQREWFTPAELARELRLSTAAVYRAVERGELPTVRLIDSGAIRIHRSALDPKERE
jgi:excisionase family DNA binding protein